MTPELPGLRLEPLKVLLHLLPGHLTMLDRTHFGPVGPTNKFRIIHVPFLLSVFVRDLEELRFYLMPMTDEEFEKEVVPLNGQQVYAVSRQPNSQHPG